MQALAVLKTLITTNIFKEKSNAIKIVEDIESTFDLSYENNMKHWKIEGLYQ